jgi:hypothetical protein
LAALCFKPEAESDEREDLLGDSLSAWGSTTGGDIGDALDEAMLTRYLRTMLFRKYGAERGGLAFAWGILPWLYQLWIRDSLHRSRMDHRPVDHDLQVGTARRLDLWHVHDVKRYGALLPHGPFSERLVKPEYWASLLAT